jgi:hypothetical protein
MEERNVPEEWAQQPRHKALMAQILRDPGGDYAAQVAQHLNGVLLDAHVASVVRALAGLRSDAAFAKSFTTDASIALHSVLYHLLGGPLHNLPPPPLECTRAEALRCGPGLVVAKPAAARFYVLMREARGKERKGDKSLLLSLRAQPFAPATHKNLRIGEVPITAAAAGGDGSNGGGGGGGDPDPATQQRDMRRLSIWWVLACGTHRKSWLSPLRVFADGQRDLLRFIAELACVDNPAWVPRPQPTEATQLRRHAWRCELEMFAGRATVEELRLTLDDVQREHACERVTLTLTLTLTLSP